MSITVFAFLFGGCAAKMEPIPDANQIGVVLMHGKGGDTGWVDPLANSLKKADVQVLTPAMPWHRGRIYDKTFEDSLEEIHWHVEKLKTMGARKVFVAGHSLGAVAAAGYGATYDDINGIILLAPGHFVMQDGFSAKVFEDVDRAKSMIDSGRGDERAYFGDINMGKSSQRLVTAKVYYSWFSPEGPAGFALNMMNLKNNIAILYIAGEKDRIPGTKDRSYAFDEAPQNSKSEFVIIPSSHLYVPRNSAQIVGDWLRNF